MSIRRVVLVTVALCACGGDPKSPDPMQDSGDAGSAGDAVSSPRCATDAECDDGLTCNGTETCVSDRCHAGVSLDCDDTVTCTTDRCSEDSGGCVHTPTDADGDGHPTIECVDATGMPLGDDCDDSDARRFPGNPELCDPVGHDEDCDADTLGDRDSDADGFIDVQCCNTQASGALRCGNDCDDARSSRSPSSVETCDGVDNDCDGDVDEGVQLELYRDLDGDGFGVFSETSRGCGVPPSGGWALLGSDCDDTRASVQPAAQEICNSGVDDDCDGTADPGCECNPGERRACGQSDGNNGFVSVGACVVGEQVCVSKIWGTCVGAVLAQAERCNDDRDDDCDGRVDENVRITCFADADDDGSGAMDASSAQFCEVSGRQVEGGCPVGFTDRDPANGIPDCDDGNAQRHDGATEQCNMFDDDCDGNIDEALTVTCFGDADDDGYPFDSAMATDFCPSVGRVPEGGCPVGFTDRPPGMGTTDCEDSSASVFPMAAEACNEIDDDCDGSADEGLRVICYPDADDDGYPADAATSTSFCPSLGRVAVAGCPVGFTNRQPIANNVDCAPGLALVNPGTADLCNSIDDDCDGTTDERPTPDCFLQDAWGGCFGGSCAVIGCQGLYADCDRTAGNGCEIDTRTDAVHCGGCGLSCPSGIACVDGLCDMDPIVEVSNYDDHTCALSGSGQIFCWGNGKDGALGNGFGQQASQPVVLEQIADAIQVAAGWDYTCAIAQGGQVWCWGNSNTGQVGVNGNRWLPRIVQGMDDAIWIATGANTTCSIRASGAVYCWGRGTSGELGNGGNVNNHVPQVVSAVTAASEVAVGNAHACAIDAGIAKCWGDGELGQLGDGLTTDSNVPVTVSGLGPVSVLGVGRRHNCAVNAAGALLCWGQNTYGQLGPGTGNAQENTPVVVPGVSNVVQIAASAGSTCVLHGDGTISCWGDNSYGQLGDGTFTANSTPQVLTAPISGTWLTAGLQSACAIGGAQQLSCWGRNDSGQLGDGTTTNRSRAAATRGLGSAVEIKPGRDHTCARTALGDPLCWGLNNLGQLGDGTTAARVVPASVSGLDSVVQLSAGSHSCARRSDGGVVCWGPNAKGKLGDGTTNTSLVPVAVVGLPPDVVDVAVHSVHSCARTASAQAYCWGDNNGGNLGTGSTGGMSLTPALMLGGLTVVDLQVAGRHTCVLTGDALVYCTGLGTGGRLGLGVTAGNRGTLTQVPGLEGMVELDLGDAHSCARRYDGAIFCWGANSSGQIGNASTGDALSPALTFGLNAIVEMDLGNAHSCARNSIGQLWCWGANAEGQLGLGNQTDALIPTAVPLVFGAHHMSMNGAVSCSLTTASPLCWGRNLAGQLGLGTTTAAETSPQPLPGM